MSDSSVENLTDIFKKNCKVESDVDNTKKSYDDGYNDGCKALASKLKLMEDKKDKQIKDLQEKNKKAEEILKKYEKIINCIKGENSGRCNISNFLPIDIIPENIKSKLIPVNQLINEKFPITLDIPYKNGDPCNNQSLGFQIPNKLEDFIVNDKELQNCIEFKGSGCGYPDKKVIIKGIDVPLLWEWKSMYSRDGKGVRIVITKFPNNCIPKYFSDCDEKYHLWICLEYDKIQDNENNKTQITITKMNIHCISPNTVLNTKFELSTTEDLIKSEISNGNINKL